MCTAMPMHACMNQLLMCVEFAHVTITGFQIWGSCQGLVVSSQLDGEWSICSGHIWTCKSMKTIPAWLNPIALLVKCAMFGIYIPPLLQANETAYSPTVWKTTVLKLHCDWSMKWNYHHYHWWLTTVAYENCYDCVAARESGNDLVPSDDALI